MKVIVVFILILRFKKEMTNEGENRCNAKIGWHDKSASKMDTKGRS